MTWWGALYDDWLADQLLDRGGDEVTRTINFLKDRLAIKRGARVLDQCCGIGTLSIALAADGVKMVGVDQAAGYIDRAKRDSASRELSIEFVAADACAFVPSTPVDAVFNWWTSFGYAEIDEENRQMLARAFDALTPGGMFALDTMNVPGILRGFQRDVVLRKETSRGDVVLLRESAIDLARGRMKKRWTYFVDGVRNVEHESSVRLYMPSDIRRMLHDVGFIDVELLGGLNGEPIDLDSQRLIATARRRS
jgi:2-polyprenyl-3-methyl-5-hydroxy-6-metoxy-1,4-benzoquinol methylase